MSEEEIPEADPKSDIDPEEKLEIDEGTLIWKDPVASGNPIQGAYLWPIAIITVIALILIGILV